MLKLEVRPEPSRAMSIASPLIALAVTVVIGTCLFLILGKDPLRGLAVFFIEPVKSVYALTELAVKATPLLLIALGLAVCFRSNVWNIGAEGQFIVGALFASGMAMQATPTTGGWFFVAVIAAGVVGGMCWAAIVALLRDRFNANEILVSLMLVYVAEQLLNYVVFADWIFFGLTVGTVMVFRRTLPLSARPVNAFRCPGYPVLPLAFCLVSAAVVLSVVRTDPVSASRGAVLLATGVPVFFWFSRRREGIP